MAEDDKDIEKLRVPLKPILDEFTCPVCFEWIADCYMTPCGHLYCRQCIAESLNRTPKCPSCNSETRPQQLVKNLHADRLVLLVKNQMEVAQKLYFERLIAGGGAAATSDNLTESQSELLAARKLSPVEALFHKHVQQSLHVYDSFLDEINKKCEAVKQAIRAEHVEKMEAVSKKLKPGDELSERVAALAARCETACARIDAGRAESERLLLEQFSAHLSAAGLARERLPCVVRARLAHRTAASDTVRVTLRPADTCADALRVAFTARQRERGDAVLGWPDAGLRFEMHRLGAPTVELKSDVALGAQGMENDCEIVIHGAVLLESERPHKCFAATFVAGAVVDYYSCKECGLKWICKDCADACHTKVGHTLSVFAEKHAPSWACCYCSKKGACKLKQ